MVCSCQKVKNPVPDFFFFFFLYTAKMKMMHLHNRVMISNDSAPISVAILNQLIEVVNRIWYIFE